MQNTPPAVAPWNLALRFLLEIAAAGSLAWWGWEATESWARYALAPAAPLAAMAIWGLFNVPGDPSRSGSAPVPVPGWLRLLIELAVFGAGATALALAWLAWAGLAFGALVVLQNATSWKRLAWLLRQ